MKISKKDALMWFRFFAELPDDEELMPHQQEIALAALAQIETAVNKRREALAAKSTACKACPVGRISWATRRIFHADAAHVCWARG